MRIPLARAVCITVSAFGSNANKHDSETYPNNHTAVPVDYERLTFLPMSMVYMPCKEVADDLDGTAYCLRHNGESRLEFGPSRKLMRGKVVCKRDQRTLWVLRPTVYISRESLVSEHR